MAQKAYILEERRRMRMQIERDKELMSKKFEKLQKSKNMSMILSKEF